MLSPPYYLPRIQLAAISLGRYREMYSTTMAKEWLPYGFFMAPLPRGGDQGAAPHFPLNEPPTAPQGRFLLEHAA